MPAALTALAKASWRRHRILSYPAADRFAGRLGRTLFISMLVVLSNVKMLTKWKKNSEFLKSKWILSSSTRDAVGAG